MDVMKMMRLVSSYVHGDVEVEILFFVSTPAVPRMLILCKTLYLIKLLKVVECNQYVWNIFSPNFTPVYEENNWHGDWMEKKWESVYGGTWEKVISTKGKIRKKKPLNGQTKCNIILYSGTTLNHTLAYILGQREY